MTNIIEKNSDGSLDILDEFERCIYTVDRNETGLVAKLAHRLYDYESFLSEGLHQVLMNYFDIPNDTYAYNLTRVKEAFEVGTMTLEDFEEFDEETISDIVQYIKDDFGNK